MSHVPNRKRNRRTTKVKNLKSVSPGALWKFGRSRLGRFVYVGVPPPTRAPRTHDPSTSDGLRNPQSPRLSILLLVIQSVDTEIVRSSITCFKITRGGSIKQVTRLFLFHGLSGCRKAQLSLGSLFWSISLRSGGPMQRYFAIQSLYTLSSCTLRRSS